MNGIIRAINYNRGIIAVEVDGGDYTIVELCGDYDVNIEDVITGDLESSGGETLFNKTNNEKMDTFIQDHGCTFQQARNFMK